MRQFFLQSVTALALFVCFLATTQADPISRTNTLAKLAPTLNKAVLSKALSAVDCAVKSGLNPSKRLAIIDYSLPSSQNRLWIFDLEHTRLLLKDFVAHGKNSGDNYATSFSNREGSHQSSLGLFLTRESYTGRHGLSLRMEGLEPGINDSALDRAIVIHGASYVDPAWIDIQGRIGRSLGCPAVRQKIASSVVNNLKGGQFVFSYYPDREWLDNSPYLNCQQAKVSAILSPLINTNS
jgi:hypothetical protein